MVSDTIIDDIYSRKGQYLEYIANYEIPRGIDADIFQDAVITFYNIGECAENPLGYFLRIVRNKCINYLRREAYKMCDVETITLSDKDEERQINLDKVDEIISELSEDVQFLIKEHIYKGKSFREISEENNLNESAIKSRFYRAMNKVQKKYKSVGVEYFYE